MTQIGDIIMSFSTVPPRGTVSFGVQYDGIDYPELYQVLPDSLKFNDTFTLPDTATSVFMEQTSYATGNFETEISGERIVQKSNANPTTGDLNWVGCFFYVVAKPSEYDG